nr:FtsL-like putative cell division protein [Chryseobacterium gilvum]
MINDVAFIILINNKIVAKKPTYRPQKKLTFIDIIKGNFLNRDELKTHYKFFLLIFVLMMAMIFTNHLVNKKIKIVNALKEQTEEYKSRNAYAQSKLIKVKMESELGKEVAADSLMTLESHPHKLLIKLDSTDAKAK